MVLIHIGVGGEQEFPVLVLDLEGARVVLVLAVVELYLLYLEEYAGPPLSLRSSPPRQL
jgi:hypothetical protein